MLLETVESKGLAHLSYVLGDDDQGVCVVIDPRRDVSIYLDTARRNNCRITHIFETHIHADFLAGSRELAKLTGADLYLSDECGDGWQYEFPHHGLKDGDHVQVGNLTFEVLHTPGHTPGSCSFFREADRTLVCGDCVLKRITPNPILSPDPIDPERRFKSLAEYLVSLAKIRAHAPTLAD